MKKNITPTSRACCPRSLLTHCARTKCTSPLVFVVTSSATTTSTNQIFFISLAMPAMTNVGLPVLVLALASKLRFSSHLASETPFVSRLAALNRIKIRLV